MAQLGDDEEAVQEAELEYSGAGRIGKAIEPVMKPMGMDWMPRKHEEILEAMARLRKSVDALEKILPDDLWPLPKYREMLFIY